MVIYHLHDRFYKKILSFKEIFIDLVTNFLEINISDIVNLDKTELVNREYILPVLKKLESDIVYKAGIEQHILVHIENQSKKSKTMPLRIFSYMAEIWNDYISQNNDIELLPPIVSIVLYNGVGKWDTELEFQKSVVNIQALEKYVPRFKYLLVDVNEIKRSKLEEHKTFLSAVFMLEQILPLSNFKLIIKALYDLSEYLVGINKDLFKSFITWIAKKLENYYGKGEKHLKKIQAHIEEYIDDYVEDLAKDIKGVKKMISQTENCFAESILKEIEEAKRELEQKRKEAEQKRKEAEQKRKEAEQKRKEETKEYILLYLENISYSITKEEKSKIESNNNIEELQRLFKGLLKEKDLKKIKNLLN